MVSTVLLVDDDSDFCVNLAGILTDVGVQIDVAHTSVAALNLARKTPYELALVDLKLPGMDGVTLYRQLREIQPEIEAVLVTAFASDSEAAAALNEGMRGIIRKPVDVRNLFSELKNAARS